MSLPASPQSSTASQKQLLFMGVSRCRTEGGGPLNSRVSSQSVSGSSSEGSKPPGEAGAEVPSAPPPATTMSTDRGTVVVTSQKSPGISVLVPGKGQTPLTGWHHLALEKANEILDVLLFSLFYF